MKRTMRVVSGWAILAAAAVLVTGTAVLAEPPAAPKVSSLAPAKDIVSQVEAYVEDLEEAVKAEADYKDNESKILKGSNTLILLALAAGLHDDDNSLKAAAPAIMKAAQQLAGAKDYQAAKSGVAAVKKAMEDKGDASDLKWAKSASLPELMKQVPLVNNRLKRNFAGDKFKKKAKDNAGDSATLAIIAQGSMADTSEAKTDENVKKWYGFCVQMRDAAAAVNKAVHAGDKDAAEKAMSALAQSCEDCHAVFKEKEKKKEE